ncbi:MAG: type II toxin-antitoxin system RelE/ParE family toxin [Beggiatoa sp.]|nr:type II toxin-antitoxin system RelE/ParE family toxin [Beggiatoa sp.]
MTTGAYRPQHAARIERILDRLDSAVRAQDMLWLPPLKGGRKGTYAVSVSGNRRMTFRFEGEHAVDVDLEDYH